MVVDGDEVDEEGGAADQHGQDEGTRYHLLDPQLACGHNMDTSHQDGRDQSIPGPGTHMAPGSQTIF